MDCLLLFGLVIGYPSIMTALALLREYEVRGRLYWHYAPHWIGVAIVAADEQSWWLRQRARAGGAGSAGAGYRSRRPMP
jgi:hypothetical protein